MTEERVGILTAIWRYFTFYRWRKAQKILRAADNQFTGSVSGIEDAYDIARDKMVAEFNSLRDAVAQVENILEDRRIRLENLNKKEEMLLRQREGSLALAEKAKGTNDVAELDKHKAAFERYQKDIEETEARQTELEKSIQENSEHLRRHMLRLTEMQAEVEKLPEEKAEQIAAFISNNAIIELNDRMLNIQSSLDKGPIDAVRKVNRELSAKARITEKLAGTDVRLQDKEYESAGRRSVSETTFDQMLAARKAEKEIKTGESRISVAKEGENRPTF